MKQESITNGLVNLVLISTILIAFFSRIVGLVTFQKTINGDEGHLGVYLLQLKGLTKGYKRGEDGRGYFNGLARFYYRPILHFFTPSIFLMKFVNLTVSIIYVCLLAISLKLVYDDYLKTKKTDWDSILLLFLNWLYIAISPLILIKWSLITIPDFMDILTLGQLLLIISIKIVQNNFPIPLIFLGSFVSILGFSGQPIMVYYIFPSLIFLFINYLPKFKFKKFIYISISATLGGILGIIPLIMYNIKQNWALIKFLTSGLIEGPYNTPIKRLLGFIYYAYPMLINFKTNNNHFWIIILLSILIISSIYHSFLNFYKKDLNQSINLFSIGLISFLIIVYSSNFTSYLADGRRVLTFYSFYFPLLFYGLLKLYATLKSLPPKTAKLLKYTPFLIIIFLIFYNTLILTKTAYNFNPNQLPQTLRDRKQAINNLLKNHVYYIYTVSWIGNPITTESQGKILWSHFPLSNLSSLPGFNFEKRLKNAGIVLFKNEPKDQLLITTLKNMKIPNKIIDQDLILFYNLENYFNNYNELLHIINNAINYPSTCPLNGCFGLYTKDLLKFSKIGKLQQSMLCNTKQKGYLFYGPYVWLKKGNYKITLYGRFSNVKGAILDVVGNKGNDVYKKFTMDPSQIDNDKYVVNFSLNNDVDDLEIRLYTLPGNDICIKKYEVTIN